MKLNSQGSLQEVDMVDTRVYLIFTRAGNYRGGKIYDKEKKFVLSSGKVELTLFENGKDIKRLYLPGEIITIPDGIPHLFYFDEDSEMIEWFDKRATSKYFERYKAIKDRAGVVITKTLEK